MHGETGNKGVTGLDGKQGPPGNNNKCTIGKASENLIGMVQTCYIHTYNVKFVVN